MRARWDLWVLAMPFFSYQINGARDRGPNPGPGTGRQIGARAGTDLSVRGAQTGARARGAADQGPGGAPKWLYKRNYTMLGWPKLIILLTKVNNKKISQPGNSKILELAGAAPEPGRPAPGLELA